MAFAHADDGTRIFYRISGPEDGPPVLMLHGLGADQMGWALQRRAFTSRYRCVFVDNRGSGRSDKPEGPYDLATLTTDTIAVLDDLDIDDLTCTFDEIVVSRLFIQGDR